MSEEPLWGFGFGLGVVEGGARRLLGPPGLKPKTRIHKPELLTLRLKALTLSLNPITPKPFTLNLEAQNPQPLTLEAQNP